MLIALYILQSNPCTNNKIKKNQIKKTKIPASQTINFLFGQINKENRPKSNNESNN